MLKKEANNDQNGQYFANFDKQAHQSDIAGIYGETEDPSYLISSDRVSFNQQQAQIHRGSTNFSKKDLTIHGLRNQQHLTNTSDLEYPQGENLLNYLNADQMMTQSSRNSMSHQSGYQKTENSKSSSRKPVDVQNQSFLE